VQEAVTIGSHPSKRWLEEPTRSFVHLVTLTFDLLTLELVCNVTRAADSLPPNFVACATFLCPVMGKHVFKLMTWLYDFDLWPLRSLCMSMMRSIVLYLCTKFEVPRPSFSESWFCVMALSSLVTLTIDLLTSKWGHLSWASLLPVFSLLHPLVLDLWSGTRHTDGLTDNGHHCIVPPPYGGRSIITHIYYYWQRYLALSRLNSVY